MEVKRSSDTRIRREVVGQMLDYAANGVRNWPVERLRARLAAGVGGPEVADAAVMQLTGNADVESFWARLEDNLRLGKVRMVFIADRIPTRLQRIVEFLNEQMTNAEVLAIEMRQYVADGHRTLVPALIGSTTMARDVKGRIDRVPFDELIAGASPEVQEFDWRLSAWAKERGWTTTTTSRARSVASPDGPYGISLHAGGVVQVSLRELHDSGQERLAGAFLERLESIAGSGLATRLPKVPVEAVLAHWAEFFDGFLPDYVAAMVAAGCAPEEPAA